MHRSGLDSGWSEWRSVSTKAVLLLLLPRQLQRAVTIPGRGSLQLQWSYGTDFTRTDSAESPLLMPLVAEVQSRWNSAGAEFIRSWPDNPTAVDLCCQRCSLGDNRFAEFWMTVVHYRNR